MAATVTIDKAYFETLMRRAEFHISEGEFNTFYDLPTVTIPKPDHDVLLRLAREYDALKEALYQGGIDSETLRVLINGKTNLGEGPGNAAATEDTSESRGVLFSHPPSTAAPATITAPSESTDRPFRRHRFSTGSSSWTVPSADTYKAPLARSTSHVNDSASHLSAGSMEKDDAYAKDSGPTQHGRSHPPGRNERRSIVLTNLSDRVTHKDVVNAIRGGTVLEIYMRPYDHSASVSFVDGSAAQGFLNYTKRHDIYINGKRIEVRWNERQFILPNHVASKVFGNGATRNLVLRNVHDKITDRRLRDDLEHIHKLVVVDLVFKAGNAFVSLNSINNALFARTCMMSRASYKGLKIEWYADECAEPLPKALSVSKKENVPPSKGKVMPVMNRFDLLNLDGPNDGSEDEGLSQGPLPPGERDFIWADSGVTI